MPTIDFGVPLLSAETLHVHDGQAENFHLGQGRLDGFEPSGLDNRDNELHAAYLVMEISFNRSRRGWHLKSRRPEGTADQLLKLAFSIPSLASG